MYSIICCFSLLSIFYLYLMYAYKVQWEFSLTQIGSWPSHLIFNFLFLLVSFQFYFFEQPKNLSGWFLILLYIYTIKSHLIETQSLSFYFSRADFLFDGAYYVICKVNELPPMCVQIVEKQIYIHLKISITITISRFYSHYLRWL